MIKTTFVLKEPKSSSETIIYLVMRWDGLQMKISTKQKVNPKFWNKDRLKVKETISEKNHQHINKELVEIEKVAYKMFNSFTDTFKRKPNSEELKNLIEQEYFQKPDDYRCGLYPAGRPGLLWHHAPFQCGFEGPDRSGTGESRGDSPWHLYHGGYG